MNEHINQHLRDYQRDGIKFLFYNYMANNGCILADDMGLGMALKSLKNTFKASNTIVI